MNAFVSNNKKYYTVMVKLLDTDGCFRYHPVINFEDQGDAIEFAKRDIERFDESFIRRRVKDFNPDDVYRKVITKDGNFKLERKTI